VPSWLQENNGSPVLHWTAIPNPAVALIPPITYAHLLTQVLGVALGHGRLREAPLGWRHRVGPVDLGRGTGSLPRSSAMASKLLPETDEHGAGVRWLLTTATVELVIRGCRRDAPAASPLTDFGRITKVSTVSYLTVPDDACRFGEASCKGSLKP
jgi:hypothetical protein